MSNSHRIILGALGLGMAAMLVSSVMYRLSGAALVKQTGRPAAQAPVSGGAPAGQQGVKMPENMPPEMAAALAKQEAGSSGTAASGQANSGQSSAMQAMMEKMGGPQADPRQNVVVERMQRLQADPNDVDALLDLADVFMSENADSARGFLNRAMVAAPNDARPSYYMGVLHTQQGEFAEAETAMLRSLTMLDNPSTRYSLAILYRYHLNREDDARAQLSAALQSPTITAELRPLVEEELAKPGK